MKKPEAVHSMLLISVILGLFFWTSTPALNLYSLQLSAFVLILLINGKHHLKQSTYSLLESTSITIIVSLTVYTTGGIESPLFFLNYVLLFILSFLLEPIIPIILSAGLAFFYMFSSIPHSSFQWITLLAFPAITPLAYFTGEMYQKIKNQKREIKQLSNKVELLEEELLEEEMQNIKS